jgi:hypothetical protein
VAGFWDSSRTCNGAVRLSNGLTVPFVSVRSGSPRAEVEYGPEGDDSKGFYSLKSLPTVRRFFLLDGRQTGTLSQKMAWPIAEEAYRRFVPSNT